MAERRRRTQRAEPPPPAILRAPSHWQSDPKMPVLYVDQMFIQGLGREVILTFGTTAMPYEQLTPELIERVQTEGLSVAPVVKIAMATEKLGELVTALNTAWQQAQQMPQTTRGGQSQ